MRVAFVALLGLPLAIAGCLGSPVPPSAHAAGPSCNASLTAASETNGDIHLHWGSVPNVTGYQVSERESGESWNQLYPQVTPASTDFTFPGTPGTSYEFTITAMNHGTPVASYCLVTVTPIPDFPTPLALGLAGIGGLGAYRLLGRKRGG